jgi:glycerol uptake facilitator-like aquaporin
MNTVEFQKSYTSEFVCSLFVALIFGWSDINEQIAKYDHLTRGLVQFTTISCLMFCSRPFSGAYINPLVTIAMLFYGRISIRKGLIYLSAQFVGSVTGAVLLRILYPSTIIRGDHSAILYGTLKYNNELNGFDITVVELFGGFLLLISYYAASIDVRTNKQISELTCGLVYLILNLSYGRNMNIGINPFRFLAGCITNLYFDNLLVFIFPSVAGALLASHWFETYLLVDQIKKEKNPKQS